MTNKILKKLWKKNAGAKREVFPRGKKIPCKLRKISLREIDDDSDKVQVSFEFVTYQGEDADGNEINAGSVTWKNFDLFDRSGTSDSGKAWEMPAEDQVKKMMIDLDSCGFDTEEYELDEIIDSVSEDPVPVYLNVVENKKNPEYANVYIQDIIPEDKIPGDDDEEYEDEEEEDEDLEDEEDDSEVEDDDDGDEEEVEEDEEEYEEEEEDDEEEEEDFEPTKGMIVMAKPKGCRRTSEYKVVTVKASAKTCKLKSIKDPSKVYPDTPFASVESEVEDVE